MIFNSKIYFLVLSLLFLLLSGCSSSDDVSSSDSKYDIWNVRPTEVVLGQGYGVYFRLDNEGYLENPIYIELEGFGNKVREGPYDYLSFSKRDRHVYFHVNQTDDKIISRVYEEVRDGEHTKLVKVAQKEHPVKFFNVEFGNIGTSITKRSMKNLMGQNVFGRNVIGQGELKTDYQETIPILIESDWCATHRTIALNRTFTFELHKCQNHPDKENYTLKIYVIFDEAHKVLLGEKTFKISKED